MTLISRWTSLLFALQIFALPANAVTIDSVLVTNTSSVDQLDANATFHTVSTLSPVIASGSNASFGHRMAFENSYIGTGHAAQVHKRNIVYQIDFTVNDPGNAGFELKAESFLSGISSITQTSDGGTAFATGANFAVRIDDSTDAPDTFEYFVPLYNDTPGVTISGITSMTAPAQNMEMTSVGIFSGTTSFSFFFTTTITPSTNILLGNFQTGSGEVDYGLGTLSAAQMVDPDSLGHFLTFTAVGNVPEPSTLVLVGMIAIAVVGVIRVKSRI